MSKKHHCNLGENLLHIIGVLLAIFGILHIVDSVLLVSRLNLPLLSYVFSTCYPKLGHTAGIALGVLIGFWEIVVGIGVYNRKRRAHIAAILLFFILSIKCVAFDSLALFTITNIIILVLLILLSKFFKEDHTYTTLSYQKIVALLSVLLTLVYGVLGSFILKKEFTGLHSLTDALYFTMGTYGSVGFGDILPRTVQAKLFCVSMIIIGLGSFATTITFVIGPMIGNKLKGIFKIMSMTSQLKDHIIICGYSYLSDALVQCLKREKKSYVILESSSDKLLKLGDQSLTVLGSNSSQETFDNLNIKAAKAVICAFDSDADNILTVLTIKGMMEKLELKNLKLIVRIENEDNIEKVKKLGVTDIVSPSLLAAQVVLEITK